MGVINVTYNGYNFLFRQSFTQQDTPMTKAPAGSVALDVDKEAERVQKALQRLVGPPDEHDMEETVDISSLVLKHGRLVFSPTLGCEQLVGVLSNANEVKKLAQAFSALGVQG